MNVQETRERQLQMLTEIKTDVAWIKKANDEQNEHLKKLNGNVMEHEKQLSRLWIYIGIGAFLVSSILTAAVRFLF